MVKEIETVPTSDALGRVTALPVFVNLSMPHYHASAMDGIAVRAEDTYVAHEQRPLLFVKALLLQGVSVYLHFTLYFTSTQK
ncbi:hypothetical protein [Anaerobacillus alkalidiazotrophicus]|uniref:hypothetical protein n=1 Tax=Anaerobacillus alkalidiazotrophicus TaxID=472963 RepID=UPI000A01942D|nr:hypothetical protein [Anaerobacillus alkalidiazotrophicus]